MIFKVSSSLPVVAVQMRDFLHVRSKPKLKYSVNAAISPTATKSGRCVFASDTESQKFLSEKFCLLLKFLERVTPFR